MRYPRRLAAFALAASLLGGAGSASAEPNVWVVDDDGQAAPGNCDADTIAQTSIAAAVDAADAGDTVQVCPGTYAESQIAIDKPLSLLGAGAGQSIIDAGRATGLLRPGVIDITAPTGTVTVDGFTLTNLSGRGDAPGTVLRVGIFEKGPAATEGEPPTYVITNNEIVGSNPLSSTDKDFEYGFYSYHSYATTTFSGNTVRGTEGNAVLLERHIGDTTVEGNVLNGGADGSSAYFNFQYNNQDNTGTHIVRGNRVDASTGSGISVVSAFLMQFLGSGRFEDVTIASNTITNVGENRSAITLANMATGDGFAGEITATIVDNTIRGTGATGSKGVRLSGLSQAVVDGNEIRDLAVGISGEAASAGHASGATSATGNNIAGNGTGAAWVSAVPLQADGNWWGSPLGPTAADNSAPAGTGDAVTGAVVWQPHSVSPNVDPLVHGLERGSV